MTGSELERDRERNWEMIASRTRTRVPKPIHGSGMLPPAPQLPLILFSPFPISPFPLPISSVSKQMLQALGSGKRIETIS